MPVRVSCPHCRTQCLVAEQHLGVPVQCGRCIRTFTTRAESRASVPAAPAVATSVRLDLGVAASPVGVVESNEDTFLLQHLVCSNLDERHELAVLVVADRRGVSVGRPLIRTAGAAMTPLLNRFLSGTDKDAAGIAEAIAACTSMGVPSGVVVVWDGQVHSGQVGKCQISHQRAGQLVPVGRDPLQLAAGDWLILACADSQAQVDQAVLQIELAKPSACAADLAQQLVERCGINNCTIAAGGCY